jgi:hypothetical protein
LDLSKSNTLLNHNILHIISLIHVTSVCNLHSTIYFESMKFD